jgi:hypothetical protein
MIFDLPIEQSLFEEILLPELTPTESQLDPSRLGISIGVPACCCDEILTPFH